MQVDIDVPSPFIELFQPTQKWRHYLYHGGRSSGKSTTVAIYLVTLATSKPTRILCCREVQRSIKESVHKLLADCIRKYNLPGWKITDETLRNRNGSEFIFKGLHGNEQDVKSTEGVDICWIEEAQSVSMQSIQVLNPTIRKAGSFLIWTMNRLAEEDPAWVWVTKQNASRAYVKQVNSTDVEGLLSDETKLDREEMRKNNPELFEHVWLGKPLTANTGSVYGKQLAQAREDGRIGKVPYDGAAPVYAALDLGVGDSTSIVFFQTVGQEIHYIDYYESCGEDLAHYTNVLANKPWDYRQIFLPHDAKARELQTGKTREEFFREQGYNNVTVLRPSRYTFGQDDINMTSRPKFSRCWFDEKKCARLLECLAAYHYEYDEKNKLLKDKPHHDWSSHAADAFMYSLIAETEQVEVQTRVHFRTFTPEAFRGEQSTGF